MHSTLQAELRFSHILAAACRHCARRTASKPRSLHSATRLRVPQESPGNSSSLNARFLADHAKEQDPRPEVVNGTNIRESNASRQPLIDAPSSGNADKEQPNYYGSPAKRRLRNRALKEKEPELEPPGWFIENNIHIFDQGVLSSNQAATIEIVPGYEGGGAPSSSSGPTGAPEKPEDDANENTSRNAVEIEDTGSETKSVSHDGSSTQDDSKSPHDDMKYYIVADQYEEVVRTTKGLLRSAKSSILAEVDDSLRNHLLLQYTGSDGAIFMDHFVQQLSRHLGCDMVSLDAQDISDFIKASEQLDAFAFAGRMLSYDVFTEVFSNPSLAHSQRPLEEEEEEDEEEEDEEEALPDIDRLMGSRSTSNMPFMVGRPITIALKDLFPSGPLKSSSSSYSGGRTKMSDHFGTSSSMKSKARSPDFSSIVDTIVKSVLTLQYAATQPLEEQDKDKTRLAAEHRQKVAKEAGVPQCSTIIHIKDLRVIQDISLGNHFLQELYQAISTLRQTGKNVIIIGTDTARKESLPITRQKINDIQDGRLMEISQNIVLTPVLPNTKSKLTLHHDRKRRLATINMRHLWQMMRHRDITMFSQLGTGFWGRDFLKDIHPADRLELESRLWSFAYVQRLATYLAGTFGPGLSIDLKTMPISGKPLIEQPLISQAADTLRHSDESKTQWVNTYRKFHKDGASESKSAEGDSIPALMKLFRSQGGADVDEQAVPSFEDSRLRQIRASATKYEKRLMSGIIEPKNIKTTFNDVHMPIETIDALQVLTTLSLTRPDAFKYGVLASDKIPGLLLYGPPGTGKTLAAKAVAKESGATMLEVSAADINDMYVGEGEKNVKALFSLAKKLSPCVVFLDEADAIFSARSNQGRRVNHRELLNQFLKEWDGMSNDSGSAFIMVATNRPMDLDDAVLRRLPRRLLVDLPTEPDRLEILKIHLRNEDLAEDVNLPSLAKKTPFYSGSDLKNLCVAAALNAVKEENVLAKQHTGSEPYQHPERRTLTAKHFNTSMEEISASISEDMTSLKDIKKFDEQYGDKKGRKKKTPKLGFPTKGKQQRDTVRVRE
ncbi:uncharacterized protein A1O9_05537 [Exophiala aquamarina CBS 119918]|uniref:AAA+ ATPase domain-containing protein n=1 Tax=Exophiala aquamarina CBS 119918 TaxID=1182545 RepID=A0A072PBX1_9EURO|nr:uncharacterized protein A1O9_05537 [Exophiala aquamarina CBS 119918]KEF57619.1 hypothetical protein A1O9_05537 [Exophiala aquamarina CBS 119918]